MTFTPTTKTKSQHKTRRKVRTQCKICRQPIFEGDSAAWLTSPMGLSHTRCA